MFLFLFISPPPRPNVLRVNFFFSSSSNALRTQYVNARLEKITYICVKRSAALPASPCYAEVSIFIANFRPFGRAITDV